MELRQLEQFVAVAEEAHFTRAATRCMIAQSALSTSIRSLERELGAALFTRTTRRVVLTDAGRALLVEARRTLAAAAAAKTAVQDVQAVLGGSLAVGGVPTFDLLDQLDLLQRFHTKFPGVDIRYYRDSSAALIEGIQEGRLNVAFVSVPHRPLPGVRIVQVAVVPIMLLCRPDHRLADQVEITLDELVKESYVGSPPGSGGYEAIDRVFAEAGTERTVSYEVNDVATMLDFVQGGLGVALMFEALSRPGLRALPLADKSMVWTLGVIAPPDEHTTAAARELLSLLDSPDNHLTYPVAPLYPADPGAGADARDLA